MMRAESNDCEQIIARVADLDIGNAESVCWVPRPASQAPAGGVHVFDRLSGGAPEILADELTRNVKAQLSAPPQ